MKKFTLITFCLWLWGLPVSGKAIIDSLLNVLQTSSTVDTHRVDLLNELGFQYWIVDPNQSEKYGLQALEAAQPLDYRPGMAFAERVIGVAHWARGNYDQALSYLYQAVEHYQQLDDPLGEANSKLNIGMVYSDQRGFQRALAYFFEAIEQFEILGEDSRIATTYTKIGAVYVEQSAYEPAYDYFTRALKIHEAQDFKYGIAEVNNRLGLLFLERKEYDEALYHLLRSVAYGKQVNDRHGILGNYEKIGRIYLQKQDLPTAEMYLQKAMEMALEIGIKATLRDLYLDFKDLALARNDPYLALEYYEQYNAIKDSLFNEQLAMQMANLQTRLEMSEKEQQLKLKQQEITLLERQTRLDNYLKLSLAFCLLILLIVAYLIIRNQRSSLKKKKELLQKNKALADAQLENARLRQRELKNELVFKNKELTSYAINFIRKNELMEELKEGIDQVKKESDRKVSKKLNSLHHLVENTLSVDKDWEDFKLYFEQVHHDFFPNLKHHHPDLSNSELRLCALIRLNLNIKEASVILGISPESVKTARYRLRKKLGVEKGEELMGYLLEIETVGNGQSFEVRN